MQRVVNQIIIEIVETASLVGNKELSSFFDTVRSLGVKIAIDDFGTGTLIIDTCKVIILESLSLISCWNFNSSYLWYH